MNDGATITAPRNQTSSQAACCEPGTRTSPRTESTGDEAEMFKALGHPIRLQMLLLLAQSDEPVCVCDLERPFPIKQPTVSHHLRVLREAGLVETEQRGTWVHYRIRRQAVRMLKGVLTTLSD